MRIPKSLNDKLSELEDHVLLTTQALTGLNSEQSAAHLRHLAAELRVLVCTSHGTEGLLWRLADEMNVSDAVVLHEIGNIDRENPLAQALRFAFAPLCTPGQGDPRLAIENYSLKEIIKRHEAVFVAGQGMTHDKIIRWVSQQMGSAHADDHIDTALAELNSIMLDNIQPFVQILYCDGLLTVEVAERVLAESASRGAYCRRYVRPTADYGLPGALARASAIVGPTVDPFSGIAGTVLLVLQGRPEQYQIPRSQYAFPPLRAGRLMIQAIKTVEGVLEVRVAGLNDSEVVSRIPAPPLEEKGLPVAVTWDGSMVSVYVNGSLAHVVGTPANAT